MPKLRLLFATFIITTATLAGCKGNSNTVQTCIISNTSYTSQNELESAAQADTLTATQPVYASIHFIESPKGMEYTVNWHLDGAEIKSETKAISKNLQDVVVYELEAEKVVKGSLKVDVIYKDTTLVTKELKIQ